MEGPCGGVPRGEPTRYDAGEVVDMRWIATQNHFNVYQVAFGAANDEGFEENVLGTRPDEEGVFEYLQPVPMPMCTCDDCTIQLAQFTATGKLAYYSCADIELVAPDGTDVSPCVASVGETGDVETTTGADASTSGDPGSTTVTDAEASSTSVASPGTSGTGSTPQESTPPDTTTDGGCRAGETSPRVLLALALLLGFRPRTPHAAG